DEIRLSAARNLTYDARSVLDKVEPEISISVEVETPIIILFLESVTLQSNMIYDNIHIDEKTT
ncbi:MAG: hypothetical protein PHR06_13750, partial [Candidatus Cloacimonetes bacterium]|nr:hypothetical protein [Candidatus Cloacimonadota bacterium]